VGQNYGKIISINESEVDITEIVPDGLGGWMERQASLALSE
jgi:type IV pilus assembly protein PilP